MIGMLALDMTVMAQGDRGSLTEQFPNMSAKERSRIAAKETEEAEKDASYQEVMRAAELSFQEGRYEEAITQYEEARSMRPYNVYPKVKIEDLRALIAKQAEKPPAMAIVEEHPIDPDTVPSSRTVAADPPESPAVSPSSAQEVVEATHAVEDAPVALSPPSPAATRALGIKAADGIIEQRYREGHAFVIERAVTVDGRLVKYKRVYHPYGQTFYFEDGLSVDERVWKARFPDR